MRSFKGFERNIRINYFSPIIYKIKHKTTERHFMQITPNNILGINYNEKFNKNRKTLPNYSVVIKTEQGKGPPIV